MDSNEMPPTMVKMEAMVYPKMDSEEDEEGVQTRFEKRVFEDEEFQDSEDNAAQDLSAKKPKLDNSTGENNPGENNNENMNEKLDDLRVKDEFKERKEEEQN